jgi:putative membrane protein
MKFTDDDYDSITRAVEQAEEQTTAELVVVVRPFSGSYLDIAYLCGAGVAWLVLIFILVSSWEIEPYTIPLEILPFFLVPALLCNVTPLRRWLTTDGRRKRQVQAAARDAFFAEGVERTRARTGVLVYLSALERRVEVLADTGVSSLVPAAEWSACVKEIRRVWKTNAPAATLIRELGRLGEMLGRYLPATVDNPNEIPNRPRVARRLKQRRERKAKEVATG